MLHCTHIIFLTWRLTKTLQKPFSQNFHVVIKIHLPLPLEYEVMVSSIKRETTLLLHSRKKIRAVPRRIRYDETRDATTRRHGTDATKTTDNDSKNNFRSEEVFLRPRNLSIDFVPDLTPYQSFVRIKLWIAFLS